MKKVIVTLRVWTSCEVHVSDEPDDDDGMYEIFDIRVPNIHGYTTSVDSKLDEEAQQLIDAAAGEA